MGVSEGYILILQFLNDFLTLTSIPHHREPHYMTLYSFPFSSIPIIMTPYRLSTLQFWSNRYIWVLYLGFFVSIIIYTQNPSPKILLINPSYCPLTRFAPLGNIQGRSDNDYNDHRSGYNGYLWSTIIHLWILLLGSSLRLFLSYHPHHSFPNHLDLFLGRDSVSIFLYGCNSCIWIRDRILIRKRNEDTINPQIQPISSCTYPSSILSPSLTNHPFPYVRYKRFCIVRTIPLPTIPYPLIIIRISYIN